MKSFRWPLRCLPSLRVAGSFPMTPADSGREYRHDTYALHQHLYDGRLQLGRTVRAFRSGDVTLTPPGVVSSYRLAAGGHHWCVHFRPVAPTAGEPALRLPVHLPLSSADAAQVRLKFAAIADAFRPRSARREERDLAAASASALFQSLLLFLARQRLHPPQRRAGRARSEAGLDAAKEHLERHFQRRIRLPELVALSGLSRNFFALRFRRRFGVTVNGYLLHLRLEMARHLLLATDRAVKEIAFECGIPDAHYFNKQFRRIHGISPSAYRSASG